MNHIHTTSNDDLVAWVNVGIQTSQWLRWSVESGSWSDIEGGDGAKRIEMLHARDEFSNLWLFRRDAVVHGAVEWAMQQIDPQGKNPALLPHPAGCVQNGVTFIDFRVHAATATILCDQGIEQWHDIGGAKTSQADGVHAALPPEMTHEAAGFDCGEDWTPRWTGLVPTEDGMVLIAPSVDGGTRTARFHDGAWDDEEQLTTEVVSAYTSGTQADFFTTTIERSDGQCETQLWRREGQRLERSGSAVPGARVWLFSDPEGWPVAITQDAILRWQPSGERIVFTSEGRIHNAAIVSGEVWLESDRGWISQQRYREEGSPDEPCL